MFVSLSQGMKDHASQVGGNLTVDFGYELMETNMKKFGIAVAAGLMALGFAPSAQAADYSIGDPNFIITSGGPDSPSITAIFFSAVSAPSFDDTYSFTIDQFGVGSGSVTTSFSSSVNAATITELFINGVDYSGSINSTGSGFQAIVGGIPIVSGVLNTIRVAGTVVGNNSYSGTMTFAATAVPEPATWAMMMLGIGAIGFAARRRRSAVTNVSYA